MSGTLLLVVSLVRLGAEDAGEVLTLQRAAYVTEAQAHADLNLPPLRQSFAEVAAELADPKVLALGWCNPSGRLVAAVRARVTTDNSRVAEIGRLTVVPDCQGQRLGTRLLAAVEEQLPATVAELRLFTGEHSAATCACAPGSATGRTLDSSHPPAIDSSSSERTAKRPYNDRLRHMITTAPRGPHAVR